MWLSECILGSLDEVCFGVVGRWIFVMLSGVEARQKFCFCVSYSPFDFAQGDGYVIRCSWFDFAHHDGWLLLLFFLLLPLLTSYVQMLLALVAVAGRYAAALEGFTVLAAFLSHNLITQSKGLSCGN